MRAPLEFTGETSTFATILQLPSTGRYTLRVLAMDGPNANFGMVERELVVAP